MRIDLLDRKQNNCESKWQQQQNEALTSKLNGMVYTVQAKTNIE